MKFAAVLLLAASLVAASPIARRDTVRTVCPSTDTDLPLR